MVTPAMSFCSKRSTVGKRSTLATPYFSMARKKLKNAFEIRTCFSMYGRFSLLVNILHEFELTTGSVDFRNRSWLQLVDHFAQGNAVMKSVLVTQPCREFLPKNGLDPFLCFPLLFGIPFAEELQKEKIL